MVGERWCVKDGVCDTVVCERWCVKMVCGEVPHGQPSATSATPATQMKGQCHQMPHLPRKWKAKRHACHANGTKCHAGHARWRSATGDQARHQSQPSATSATPATQMEGQCHQAPRAPRKVARRPAQCHKCHACHANGRSMSRKMVCDKVVCERWCVTKRCVKDGV